MFQSVLIGAAQAISVIPGVSRAAATIVGGMATGLSRESAVEFSFLLAVPTILAATVLDLVKTGQTFTGGDFMVLGIGFIGAFLSAILSVKLFLGFVQKHTLIPFGIYRIGITVLFLLRTILLPTSV